MQIIMLNAQPTITLNNTRHEFSCQIMIRAGKPDLKSLKKESPVCLEVLNNCYEINVTINSQKCSFVQPDRFFPIFLSHIYFDWFQIGVIFQLGKITHPFSLFFFSRKDGGKAEEEGQHAAQKCLFKY